MKIILAFDFNNMAHRCVHLGEVSDMSARSMNLLTLLIFRNIYDFVERIASVMDPGDHIDVVLALDSTDGYWRRDLYAPYKMDRAKRRENDGIDWPKAYQTFNDLTTMIGQHTPWKILRVSQCEADDIMYVLSTLANDTDTSLIIHSSDSDYAQLVNDNVMVFAPHTNRYLEFPCDLRVGGTPIVCETAEQYLQFAIMTGQGGKDNVYNIKTPTDWDATAGARKPGFGVVAASRILTKASSAGSSLEGVLKEAGLWENYQRNNNLINMRELPRPYYEIILQAYHNYDTQVESLTNIFALAERFGWASILPDAAKMTAHLDLWAGKEASSVPLPEDEGLLLPEEEALPFEL